jgi:hypothetical protein
VRTSPSTFLTNFAAGGKALFYDLEVVSSVATYHWITNAASFYLYSSAELITNGAFETVTGTADDDTTDTWTASWTGTSGGTGGYVDSTATVQSGVKAVEICAANDGTRSTLDSTGQTITVSASTRYRLSMWQRGEGTNFGFYAIVNNADAKYLQANGTWSASEYYFSTAYKGTTYTRKTQSFVSASNATTLKIIFASAAEKNALAYFDTIGLREVLTTDSGQIIQGGISDISAGINIDEYGGGIGDIGDFTFSVLNQTEQSETLKNDVFINRNVTLRMGFVDTTNGVSLDEMLILAKYVVDDVPMFKWTEMEFRCNDFTITMDTQLPDVLITKAAYPRAPEENIGKAVPYLYGDFETFNTANVIGTLKNRHLELYDLAPTVVTSYDKSTYGEPTHTIASHVCHTIGDAYIVSGGLVGKIVDSLTEVNTTVAGVDMPKTVTVTWFIIPDSESGDSDGGESDTNQYDYAKDKDITTYYQVPDAKAVYYKINKQGSGTIRIYSGTAQVAVTIHFGTLSTAGGGKYARVIGKIIGAASYSDYADYDSGDNNTTVTTPLTLTGTIDWTTIMDTWSFGLGATGLTAQIKQICLEINTRVSLKYGNTYYNQMKYGARGGTNRG